MTLVARDREDYLYRVARDATHAARVGDFRSSYAAVRCLSGAKKPEHGPIKLKNGELASSSEETALRWQEHVVGVSGGKVVEDIASPETCSRFRDDAQQH